jgi:hypothetical protein
VRVIAVHGDPEAMHGLGRAVADRLTGSVLTPGQGETVLL